MGSFSKPVRWLILFSCVWSLAVVLAAWWFDLTARFSSSYYDPIAWKIWAFPLLLAWFGRLVWRLLSKKA